MPAPTRRVAAAAVALLAAAAFLASAAGALRTARDSADIWPNSAVADIWPNGVTVADRSDVS